MHDSLLSQSVRESPPGEEMHVEVAYSRYVYMLEYIFCISLSNLNLQTLRKKGFNGCDSPEPDGEDSIDQSPLNDDKYRKATEDLDVLFKRYGVSHLIVIE